MGVPSENQSQFTKDWYASWKNSTPNKHNFFEILPKRSNVIKAEASVNHIVVLKENGELWAGGDNQSQQLGLPQSVTETFQKTASNRDISVEENVTYVIDGTYTLKLLNTSGGVIDTNVMKFKSGGYYVTLDNKYKKLDGTLIQEDAIDGITISSEECI